MRFARLVLMVLAASAHPSVAHAEPERFAWRGPDCANSAPVLEQRLSELVESADRERLSGSVGVSHAGNVFVVEVTIALDGRPLGTRRFEANSCASSAETAAVAASLAVYDGEATSVAAAQSHISPDIWTQQPEPVPDFSRPKPPPHTAPPRLLEPRVGVLGVVEVGALAAPAWGGVVAVELGVGKRWSFGVLGLATTEQRRHLQQSQVVYMSLVGASARMCAAPWVDDVYRVDGCAGARWTDARGRGEGFDVNRSAHLTWVAPQLGLGVSVTAPKPLVWRWELDGALPLARRRFLVNGSELSQAAPVVGAMRLGLLVSF